MAGTPSYKIHDDTGRYVAATIDATLAAALIGAAGSDGWLVKFSGRIVFREGAEEVRAADSVDAAAEIIDATIHRQQVERYQKRVYI